MVNDNKPKALASPNKSVPIKPLAELSIKSEKSAESRPEYAQKLVADAEKNVKTAEKAGENNNKELKKKIWNKNKKNGGHKYIRKPVALEKPTYVDPPATLKIKEYIVKEDNVLYFSGPNHFLSALFPVKINVDGNDYNSVEHFYQACKLFTLAGKEVAAIIKGANTPIEVKQATKRLLRGKVSKEEIEKWKLNDSFTILQHALWNKFSQAEELRKQLLATGDKILVQAYDGDNFFAAAASNKKCDEWVKENADAALKIPEITKNEDYQYVPLFANGKNVLGYISMQIRDKIRAESA